MELYAGHRMKIGFLFISSYKAMESIGHLVASARAFSRKNCIAILNGAVNQNPPGDMDIDRLAIKELIQVLETGRYDVLVIRDLEDITSNEDDWENFINMVNEMSVEIFCLNRGCYVTNNYEEC